MSIRLFRQLGVIFTFGALGSAVLQAQQHLPVLEIAAGKTHVITADSVLVGQLILGDSARLVFEGQHAVYFLRADRIAAGRGVRLDGRGTPGETGKAGSAGQTSDGVCGSGTAGKPGAPGSAGAPGKSVTIETSVLELAGLLEIDLSGGNGGDGGRGGEGGRGGRSTLHCDCHGGDGGSGGAGAQGGNGGKLVLKIANLKTDELLSKITLFNRGGYAGLGGEPGKGGLRGEGSREATSRKGAPGKPGTPGKRGQDGPALFQTLVAD